MESNLREACYATQKLACMSVERSLLCMCGTFIGSGRAFLRLAVEWVGFLTCVNVTTVICLVGLPCRLL